MAVSKREQIIVTVVNDLKQVSVLKQVQRIQPSDESALMNYAATQLPLAAVIGGVPVPEPHNASRSKSYPNDVFLSKLNISMYFYFMERTEPDTVLSSILNDVWVKLYSNPTRGGLAIKTILMPQLEVAAWDPYVAFSVIAEVTYMHDIGGI